MACATEPLPRGWVVWRLPVTAGLTAFAKAALASSPSYPYGAIVATTTTSDGAPVAAFKSHHTWTYRNGALVTGLCIPGITLLWQPDTAPQLSSDTIDTPDPSAAVFVDDAAPTNWKLVAASAIAIVAVSVLFAMAIQHAGRAATR